MNTLTLNQKMEALLALGTEVSIRFRSEQFMRETSTKRWYIVQYVEIKKGCILSAVCGNGNTLEEAIEDHWKQLTEIQPEEYIVTNAGNRARKAVLWNGFMWERIEENKNVKR